MSGAAGEIKNGTRRDFMVGASMAAGGMAFLGTRQAAEAQTPKAAASNPGQAQIPKVPATSAPQQADLRASAPVEKHVSQLGPLKNLSGTWIGQGFNVISLPDFDNPQGPQPFRLKINATREILEFNHIGGAVPNRGSKGQNDINLFGLTYLQRISDTLTNAALHIEPGLWLHVPSTTVPDQPATVVRQGSIPHGTSVLAQGAVIPTVHGGPLIKAVDTTPFTAAGPVTDPNYLAPFDEATLPPGFLPPFLKNPNLALSEAILGQNIVKTEVLLISTKPSSSPGFTGGGLLNIPFLVSNANATQMDAIFWIETVELPDKTQFMQLQYTQTIILSFLDKSWPHISVATLIKQ